MDGNDMRFCLLDENGYLHNLWREKASHARGDVSSEKRGSHTEGMCLARP